MNTLTNGDNLIVVSRPRRQVLRLTKAGKAEKSGPKQEGLGI